MPPSCKSRCWHSRQHDCKQGHQRFVALAVTMGNGLGLITCARATAMSASVTVSIGELTTGVAKRMFLVSCVVRSTCKVAARQCKDGTTVRRMAWQCAKVTGGMLLLRLCGLCICRGKVCGIAQPVHA